MGVHRLLSAIPDASHDTEALKLGCIALSHSCMPAVGVRITTDRVPDPPWSVLAWTPAGPVMALRRYRWREDLLREAVPGLVMERRESGLRAAVRQGHHPWAIPRPAPSKRAGHYVLGARRAPPLAEYRFEFRGGYRGGTAHISLETPVLRCSWSYTVNRDPLEDETLDDLASWVFDVLRGHFEAP